MIFLSHAHQAGGASTEHALSVALTGILDALKSSDWTTRKAASVALAGIAVSAGALLGSFKSSCLRSLEGCRFDKVGLHFGLLLVLLHIMFVYALIFHLFFIGETCEGCNCACHTVLEKPARNWFS